MPPPTVVLRNYKSIEEMHTWTEFHKDEYLILPTGHPVPRGIDQMHDIWVALKDPLIVRCEAYKYSLGLKSYHDIDFLFDLCQHCFVRYGYAFEDMVCGVVNGSRCPYEIDMREAT